MNLVRRAGHRGAYLGFLAVLDILFGYSLLSTPIELGGDHLPLGQHTLGWIWLVVGCFLATGVFLRQDRIHFAVASLWKVVFGGLYVDLWWQGFPRAWVAVAIWFAFAGITLVVASWAEPVTVIDPTSSSSHSDIPGPVE